MDWIAFSVAACLAPFLLAAETAAQVKIHIDAARALRTMRGGIGASFHVIDTELPGRRPPLGSWSGSAWGGNPAPDDESRWRELFRHAEWLGLDWCRVEF